MSSLAPATPQPPLRTAERNSGPASFPGRSLASRQGGVVLALGFALAVGFLTRVALLIFAARDVSWNLSLVASFAWGVLFDFSAALWWAAPLAVFLALLPTRTFELKAMRYAAHAGLVAILYALLFGAVAEWLFWDEFGVRFNFIAVDYLVYTTEVIGNIRESYPMPVIYASLFVASVGCYWLVLRTGWPTRWLEAAATPAKGRWRGAAVLALLCGLFGGGLQQSYIPNFANSFNRELAKDGLWSLFAAFWDNQLDYDTFYPGVSTEVAFERMHKILARDGAAPLTKEPRDLLRLVRHPGPEQKLNVIQITVESLSAEFLGRFGSKDGLTPNLDALAPQALVFENFYATGTRTDRGMEALTLSVPPTAGRSLVKRPNNENLFTLGSVFRSKGYATAFVYGGFGYFDNMNYFFGENGYRVVDRNSVEKSDITFANAWGACDADLFRWTLREADRDYASGKPFFHFVMTTSNHRPFTYPEGKIDLPSKTSGRFGGVKYTDYAIGELLRAAADKPWFKNTIFVIVADHCASSAGRTELPVERYHIPLFIYAPGGQVKPGVVRTLTSQIDYAPTLLGLLGWTYPSRFYGRDVLSGNGVEPGRALIGNYQKLGIYQDGKLGVLKPVRQAMTFRYDPKTHETVPTEHEPAVIDDAIAYYQTASWLFKNGHQRELTAAERARLAVP
jgi:phosphoglycerol transferase MdoB-like AlkP superfamily enzyme